MGWRESLRTQTHSLRWGVEIGPVVLEKKVFKFCQCMYFRYFIITCISPKGRDFHLNKLESPSLKAALCQVWLKSLVAHGWFSLIPSFITRGSTLWHSLVFNQICMTSVASSYPMKLRVMYACCFSFSGSLSKFCLDEIWLVYMQWFF